MSASRPVLLTLVLVLAPRLAAPQAATLTPERMADFLATAPIVKEKTTSTGVTRPIRATLSDGVLTHDAQFQTVDQAKAVFTAGKASEVDFKDSYRFNIAGYRLAQMIGLETVPMSVPRRYKNKDAAVTWWIDDVMFDEVGRQKMKDKKLGPEPERTQKQIYNMYVWDELIQNRDRNGGNILWTKDWTMWLIDHTRAFRLGKELVAPGDLTRCDRRLLDGMRALTAESLAKATGDSLTKEEQGAVLARRDLIVKHFDDRIAKLGEGILFTY